MRPVAWSQKRQINCFRGEQGPGERRTGHLAAAQGGLTRVASAGLWRCRPLQASCVAPCCQRRRHSRAVRRFARWILKTWFALGWAPRLRRPGRADTGCESWTLAVPTTLSILCGATVPAAAASACCAGVAGVGCVLASMSLELWLPAGTWNNCGSFEGAWYDPCRAPSGMVAPAQVISGSSAAGRLLRICLLPETPCKHSRAGADLKPCAPDHTHQSGGGR